MNNAIKLAIEKGGYKTKGNKCRYCFCWTMNDWFLVCNAGYCHDCD